MRYQIVRARTKVAEEAARTARSNTALIHSGLGSVACLVVSCEHACRCWIHRPVSVRTRRGRKLCMQECSDRHTGHAVFSLEIRPGQGKAIRRLNLIMHSHTMNALTGPMIDA